MTRVTYADHNKDMNTATAGQIFANTMRTNFGVTARTRKNSASVKRDMIEAIERALYIPGYYSDEKTAIFRTAAGAFFGYQKHIDGYRVDGMVRYQIEQMSPYQFAAFLGSQVDAGVTNTGDAERFYASMREAA